MAQNLQTCTDTMGHGWAQMISSITGKVFDSWTLSKPAGFKPDLAGRTAFVNNWKPTYVPGAPYPQGGTSLETQGDPSLLPMQFRHVIQGLSRHFFI